MMVIPGAVAWQPPGRRRVWSWLSLGFVAWRGRRQQQQHDLADLRQDVDARERRFSLTIQKFLKKKKPGF